MLEIACDETCTYLHAGRESMAAKNRETMLRFLSSGELRKFRSLKDGQIAALFLIEGTIAGNARGELKGIKDRDILDAMENARTNLQTAGSGLIYEHRVALPAVQTLSQRIRERLDEYRSQGPYQGFPQITEVDAIAALEALEPVVRMYIDSGEDDRAYLRLIAIRTPWIKGSEEKPSGLLIT